MALLQYFLFPKQAVGLIGQWAAEFANPQYNVLIDTVVLTFFSYFSCYLLLNHTHRHTHTHCLICSGCDSKRPKTGWLNQQECISHSLGGWQSKIKVPADLVSTLFPACRRDFWVCPHVTGKDRVEEEGEKEKKSLVSLPTRAIVSSHKPQLSWPHPSLITFQRCVSKYHRLEG